jgi:hypothetical protein
MSLFGGLDVRLDPWDVDYRTELPLESDEGPSEDVALDMELPPEEAGQKRPSNKLLATVAIVSHTAEAVGRNRKRA